MTLLHDDGVLRNIVGSSATQRAMSILVFRRERVVGGSFGAPGLACGLPRHRVFVSATSGVVCRCTGCAIPSINVRACCAAGRAGGATTSLSHHGGGFRSFGSVSSITRLDRRTSRGAAVEVGSRIDQGRSVARPASAAWRSTSRRLSAVCQVVRASNSCRRRLVG